MFRLSSLPTALALALLISASTSLAQDPIFSGPQIGEKLSDFKATFVRGENQGEAFDFVGKAEGKPAVLIFWHEIERPAFGLIRLLTTYILDQELQSAVVLLADDPEAPGFKGAIGYLPQQLTVGVSSDGQEGPGKYGLNRHVKLTILVAKDNVVTANYAMVQPSVQADGPKILKAIADVLGKEPPTLTELQSKSRNQPRGMNSRGMNKRGDKTDTQMKTRKAATQDAKLTSLLRSVINKEAINDEVEKAAKRVDNYISENDAARADLIRRAKMIVDSDKLKNYGTKAAQEQILRWSKLTPTQSPPSPPKR